MSITTYINIWSDYKIDRLTQMEHTDPAPKVQGQARALESHAESYPSSGARNSMGGPQT